MSSGSQGIVDSDTLPLNVSREMLQQHSSLTTIKKKLVRKALDMLKRIMDDDPDEMISEDEGIHSFNTLCWSSITIPSAVVITQCSRLNLHCDRSMNHSMFVVTSACKKDCSF